MKTIMSGIDVSQVRVYPNRDRLLNTVYRANNIPIQLIASVKLECGATAGSKAAVTIQYHETTPPVTLNQIVGFYSGYANQADYAQISAVIPANYYYRIATSISGTGVVTLVYWDEIEYTV